MRLLNTFLLAEAAGLALSFPRSDLTAHSPIAVRDNLALIAPLNTSAHVTNAWPIACYVTIGSQAVDRLSCNDLIIYFMSRPDVSLPTIWTPRADELQWELHGCKVIITSGLWDSVFSMQNVVEQMERVLAVCQPPAYLGVGGSAPVNGMAGFMWASFHVQVTGVAP